MRSGRILLFLVVVLVAFSVGSQIHADSSISNIKASRALIDQICKSTRNPSFCLKVLNSDPRTPKASLRDLGQISIDLAESHAKTTYKLVVSLLKKTIDRRLKGVYKSCQENYDDAIYNLGEGRQAFNSGDNGGLNNYASAALTDADTCQEGFVELSLQEPPQVKQANQKMEDLASIILVISNRL